METSLSDLDLNIELLRISTFVGWPGVDAYNLPVKPSAFDMAKAGFYYTGKDDEVKCFSCGTLIKDWEPHNDPHVAHVTRNTLCPFLLGKETTNRSVMVPEDREYNAILTMLRYAGEKVLRTVNGQPFSTSSLVGDTLQNLYGESMMADERRSRSRPFSSPLRSTSGSPRLNQSRKEFRSSSSTGPRISKRPGAQYPSKESPPPSGPRRSSASDMNQTDCARQAVQRTRSYASDPRSARAHSVETIANRQTSNPGTDLSAYQESEEARLATFSEWVGVRGSSAQEFAQAGFIFIGQPDRVQCVFCNGILRNWNDNDIPMAEHKKHFPHCQFVKDYLSAAVSVSKPKHPKYKTEPSRLSSFSTWPLSNNPKPQELAKAGFFYVGHGDSVKCFFCDGGLRNWELEDDPWREHARWFPNCIYVKQAKGKAYIDAVVQNLADYQTATVDPNETLVKNLASNANSGKNGQGNEGLREVDPRAVMARMDSALVKTVVKMDIPRHLVKKAIKKRLAEDGGDFSSAEALLEAVFNLDLKEEEIGVGDSEDAEMPEPSGPASSENQESIRLQEENRQLKEQRQCKICMDEEVCMAFLPCGHLVCCATCAPALNSCPICRAKIRGTVRTYMS